VLHPWPTSSVRASDEAGKAGAHLVHADGIEFFRPSAFPQMKKDGCAIFAPLNAADRENTVPRRVVVQARESRCARIRRWYTRHSPFHPDGPAAGADDAGSARIQGTPLLSAGADPDPIQDPGMVTAASAQIGRVRPALFEHVKIVLMAEFRIRSKILTSPRGT